MKGLRAPGLQASLAVKAFVCSFEELRELSPGHVHIVDILASSANVQCILEVFMGLCPSRNRGIVVDRWSMLVRHAVRVQRRRRMWAWLGRFLRMVKQRGIEAMRDDEEEMEEVEED